MSFRRLSLNELPPFVKLWKARRRCSLARFERKERLQHARLTAERYRTILFRHGNSRNSRQQCLFLSPSPVIIIFSLITRTPHAKGRGLYHLIPSLSRSPALKSYHEKSTKNAHPDSPSHRSDAASSAFFLLAVTAA